MKIKKKVFCKEMKQCRGSCIPLSTHFSVKIEKFKFKYFFKFRADLYQTSHFY